MSRLFQNPPDEIVKHTRPIKSFGRWQAVVGHETSMPVRDNAVEALDDLKSLCEPDRNLTICLDRNTYTVLGSRNRIRRIS